MPALELRVLRPGDEAAAAEFLRPHSDDSMILRAALHHDGLVGRSRPGQRSWVGAFEGGGLRGIGSVAGNGVMAIQAPGCSEDLVSVLAATSGRRIRGLVGPADQVERGRSALPPGGGAAAVDRVERLYRLELSELRTPAALQAGRLRCRLPEEFHRETLVEWGVAYDVETLGAREDAALWENNRASLARLLTRNSQWLLQAGSVPVSMSAFSSSVPDCVQIGGVYTPPPLRGRGYARAVVAGSLLVARARGARTSVLFTPRDNLAAHRAYESLGYRQVGQFGILLLAPAPGDPS